MDKEKLLDVMDALLELCPAADFDEAAEEIKKLINLVFTNDLISRKKAIEIIMAEFPEVHYPNWYADMLERMPSVLEKGESIC